MSDLQFPPLEAKTAVARSRCIGNSLAFLRLTMPYPDLLETALLKHAHHALPKTLHKNPKSHSEPNSDRFNPAGRKEYWRETTKLGSTMRRKTSILIASTRPLESLKLQQPQRHRSGPKGQPMKPHNLADTGRPSGQDQ